MLFGVGVALFRHKLKSTCSRLFCQIFMHQSLFQPLMIQQLGDKANALTQIAQPAAWKGFLASFYGGVAEEIQLRLFVMSLLAWLGSFISKTIEGKPTYTMFWIANILAAVLFASDIYQLRHCLFHLQRLSLFASCC